MFKNDPGAVYEINAYNIIIMGGRLIIGWPDEPFLGHAFIVLRGNPLSAYFVPPGRGPTVGSKAIGKMIHASILRMLKVLTGKFIVLFEN